MAYGPNKRGKFWLAGYRSPANENGKQEILSEPNLEIDFKEP
jgi:hypothetical protein